MWLLAWYQTMAFNPKSDTWIAPCDLCGSLCHDILKLSHGTTARRCADCGLITFIHAEEALGGRGAAGPGMPPDLVMGAMQGLSRESPVLIIGTPSAAVVQAAMAVGAHLTALVDPGSGQIPNVSTVEWSLDAASFPPERFDLILCLRGLESFPVPSRLFDRARFWLRPTGSLLVGALNLDSLPARLRRRNWLLRYAAGAEHMLSLETIKGYAKRYGFGIKSVRTRSHTDEVASIITGSDNPSWLMSMASAPLALAASMLGMGVLAVVEMIKEGYAVRPLRRELEESAEGSPGLAPALYTSAQREVVVDYR